MSDVFLPSLLKQKAVWWKYLGTDGSGSEMYDEPVEVKCRWEDKTQVFLNTNNEEQVSKSIVFVDRQMKNKDVLWEGRIVDLDDMANPFNNEGAWAISRFDRIPNPRGKRFVRKAYL